MSASDPKRGHWTCVQLDFAPRVLESVFARSRGGRSLPRDLPMARNGKSKKAQLQVRRVVHVPLREVSGICLRRSRNGRMSLIAVGDRAAKIAWFSQPRSDGGQIDWQTRSIAKLSGSKLPKDDP